MQNTSLTVGTYIVPGVRLGPENPLPYFRDPQRHVAVKMLDTIPPEKRDTFGQNAAPRVLPYRMQDNYTRCKTDVSFKSVTLENQFLRAVFLPEVGGRLVSLVHKPLSRELLSCNPVFQPANLAIRNAWFSGGIEWNIGHSGHTVFTCSPLFAGRIVCPDGTPGLRLYEFERMHGTFWHIDFWLPPDSPFLLAHTRIINPASRAIPMYWWTNIAVPEAPDVRVLAPAHTAIYIDFSEQGARFGLTPMPDLPSIAAFEKKNPAHQSSPTNRCGARTTDGSYAVNSPFANEFFFQCENAPMPWEAALDGNGSGFVECSTPRLAYRKLFCWGMHQGGRHWQEFLAKAGTAYIEIQGGLAPTQGHGLTMPAATAWDWTQAFGYGSIDPKDVHHAEWNHAVSSVDSFFAKTMSLATISSYEKQFRSKADQPIREYYCQGSGWGALERERLKSQTLAITFSPAFDFPTSSLGPEQQKWLTLLKTGCLPDQSPDQEPGEWMIGDEWLMLLEKSMQHPENASWYAWLHRGVMNMEAVDEAAAEAAWKESIRIKPSAWAHRNLGFLARRRKQLDVAKGYYRSAWMLNRANPCRPLAEEWIGLLLDTNEISEALAVLESLPAEMKGHDRMRILQARAALAQNRLNEVEQLLNHEYAVIREGETALTDIWFEVKARRLALERNVPLTDTFKTEVRRLYRPSSSIDFRLVNQ